ncbi:protein DEHYDRATION-INDUCED 19 homolog 2-like [Phragmites australis]|uniref:protein DEHYDRATION-INDUCED 19 homolog 2-like n=1 Tax=Phragmites australis TaxID=29695 RepID=UPI002D784CDC|nr:protein DEHYDRATION-INDUCED 19 homolog 2-like [Phragmites australis]
MNMDAYERLTAETRRRGSCFDALIGLEEVDGSDDEGEERAAAGVVDELPCPFCGEEFDVVGLCCHIDDEHHAEASAGVCPICTDRVGMNLVGHIKSQHPGFLKDKWRNRRDSSESHYSTLALLKKDLHERNLQPLFGGFSRATSISTVPDPLLSSFVGNFFEVELPKDAEKESLDETDEESASFEQKAAESADEPLLPEVKEERTRRSQFVQGLVLSLMFDDIL